MVVSLKGKAMKFDISENKGDFKFMKKSYRYLPGTAFWSEVLGTGTSYIMSGIRIWRLS
jgi:hypothetical protein